MRGGKVWFITGCSKGFGLAWAAAALRRGDRVAATARDVAALEPLIEEHGDLVLPIGLDVRDLDADFAAVRRAQEWFGRLDVVVNNAGFGLFGTVEEVSPEQAREQIETNFFGALWVTKAALPIMRAQKRGHIVQVSSLGGVTAYPGIGLYNASKWALEAFSQSLAEETAGLGVRVTLIEPQGYATDWSGPSAVRAEPMAIYDEVRAARAKSSASRRRGDPEASATALLELVDAEDPPLRCFFGRDALGIIRADYEARIDGWEHWDRLARQAHGDA